MLRLQGTAEGSLLFWFHPCQLHVTEGTAGAGSSTYLLCLHCTHGVFHGEMRSHFHIHLPLEMGLTVLGEHSSFPRAVIFLLCCLSFFQAGCQLRFELNFSNTWMGKAWSKFHWLCVVGSCLRVPRVVLLDNNPNP